MRGIRFHKGTLFLLYLLLMSCGGSPERDGAPSRAPDIASIPDAVPRAEPRSKYGNPAHYEVFGQRYYTLASATGYQARGIASWYGTKFHGRRTSSGEVYDMYAMTAAHKTLPLPTYVEVTNLENGRSVVVKVNDRGPFHDNRLIDLSYSAASKLGIIAKGTGLVEVRAIVPGEGLQKTAATTRPAAAPADGGAEMFLQVGAFSSLSRAEQVRARLQAEGASQVQVVPYDRPQGRLYRVRVGPLASVAAGDSLAERLLHMGFADARLVVE